MYRQHSYGSSDSGRVDDDNDDDDDGYGSSSQRHHYQEQQQQREQQHQQPLYYDDFSNSNNTNKKKNTGMDFGQDTQEVPDFTPDEETTTASAEDELLDMHILHNNNRNSNGACHYSFPAPDCLTIIRLMRGNNTCVDCQGYDEIDGSSSGSGGSTVQVEPMYASITHGTLLCRHCAAGHVKRDERAFGIKSFMDDIWGLVDVLSLLEGGNTKFREFCAITNAYPTLESTVSDRTQFINGLYASLPVKAYRSLLRKAVAKAQDDRDGLVVAVNQQRQQQARLRQNNRNYPPPPEGMLPELHPGEAHRFMKVLPMLSIYEYYTTVLEKEWPKSINAEGELIVENDGDDNGDSNSVDSVNKSESSNLDEEPPNDDDDVVDGGGSIAENAFGGETIDEGIGVDNETYDDDCAIVRPSESIIGACELFEEEKKDIDVEDDHADDQEGNAFLMNSGVGDVLLLTDSTKAHLDVDHKVNADGCYDSSLATASTEEIDVVPDQSLQLTVYQPDNDGDESSSLPEGASLAGDYSLFGEAVISLAGTEATEKGLHRMGSVAAPSDDVMAPLSENTAGVNEYVLPLKEQGNVDSAGNKRRGLRRIVRPISESSSSNEMAGNRYDEANLDLSSRQELSDCPTTFVRDANDSDARSIVSSSADSWSSAGSSVGDLELRSLPDGKSVCSSEMEAIPEVNNKDVMVKNLESTMASQDSFRNLDTDDMGNTTYGPEDTGNSAKDIHELENSVSILDGNDEHPTGIDEYNARDSKMQTSSLQRSLLKLDAAIGEIDPKQRQLSSVQRQRGKHVSFRGLPNVPPERSNGAMPSRVQPVQGRERRSGGFLEGFQLRNVGKKLNALSPPEKQERQHGNHGPERRLPQAINGRMGPPVSKQSNYTPQTRASYAFGLQHRNSNGQQHMQPPQHQYELSQPFQQQETQQEAQQATQQETQQRQSPAPKRVVSAYKHQMKSIARNFNRQNSTGSNLSQQQRQHERQSIPEYSGNLAARAQVEDWDAPAQLQQQPPAHAGTNPILGSFRSSSPRMNGLFTGNRLGSFRSSSPQLNAANDTNEDNSANRLSQLLRDTFSSKDKV